MTQEEYDKGFADGYRVGPDGIEPDGEPACVGYDESMFRFDDYRRGLSEGRSKRIDEKLEQGDVQGWIR